MLLCNDSRSCGDIKGGDAMSEMVDKVAKALCDVYGRDHKSAILFYTRAEAAIRAMREPTEAMKVEASWLDKQAGFNNLSLMASGYSLMIEAALK